MRRSLPILALSAGLVLVTIIASCGGGGDGSRPPTVVSGNVRTAVGVASAGSFERLWKMAKAWWNSEAVAQVPGVNVAIEGSSNSATTDELGFFRLDGNQFGPSALRFSGNGADARYPLTLPAGGSVVLIDVALVGNRITVGEHRIAIEGPITGLDCQANLMQVLSGSLVAFRVRFNSATAILDPDARPLTCGGLVIGGSAEVEGTVDDSGDVIAVQIRTNPASAGPAPSRTFEATLVTKACPSSLQVAAESGNVHVNLSSSTTILDTNDQALACHGLAAGDPLEIEGTQGGFGVDASQVRRLMPPPTPTPTAGA